MRPALHVIAWPGPGRLATMAHTRGGVDLAADMAGLARAGVDVVVSALTGPEHDRLGLTEVSGAAAEAGITWLSFPIPDRGVPSAEDLRSDTETLALGIRLAAHVRAGRFVVTQCFAGIGRSTLLAAVTLVMLGVDAEEALRMVADARGLPVPDTTAQRDWLLSFAATHAGR